MNLKFSLIVIGAGGTGTYFLKEFARYIASNDKKRNITSMYIVDGDVVEKKNLSRQCFCEEDIGRNKAGVMAEALNDAFDLNFQAYAGYLTAAKQLKELDKDYDAIPVLISCVDNHACRLVLEEYFDSQKSCIYFDAANEFDTGEVVFSYKYQNELAGPVRSFYFPDIKKGEHKDRTQLSCEELNSVSPQHIFTNMMAGNILCTGIVNLLEDILTPGFVYFNALKYESGFVKWRKSKDA